MNNQMLQEPFEGKKLLILLFGMFLVFSLGGVSAEKMWNFNNHSLNVSHGSYFMEKKNE